MHALSQIHLFFRSEVTAFAVVSDREAGIKYPLIDSRMIPDVVFLDPKLCAQRVRHTVADSQ